VPLGGRLPCGRGSPDYLKRHPAPCTPPIWCITTASDSGSQAAGQSTVGVRRRWPARRVRDQRNLTINDSLFSLRLRSRDRTGVHIRPARASPHPSKRLKRVLSSSHRRFGVLPLLPQQAAAAPKLKAFVEYALARSRKREAPGTSLKPGARVPSSFIRAGERSLVRGQGRRDFEGTDLYKTVQDRAECRHGRSLRIC